MTTHKQCKKQEEKGKGTGYRTSTSAVLQTMQNDRRPFFPCQNLMTIQKQWQEETMKGRQWKGDNSNTFENTEKIAEFTLRNRLKDTHSHAWEDSHCRVCGGFWSQFGCQAGAGGDGMGREDVCLMGEADGFSEITWSWPLIKWVPLLPDVSRWEKCWVGQGELAAPGCGFSYGFTIALGCGCGGSRSSGCTLDNGREAFDDEDEDDVKYVNWQYRWVVEQQAQPQLGAVRVKIDVRDWVPCVMWSSSLKRRMLKEATIRTGANCNSQVNVPLKSSTRSEEPWPHLDPWVFRPPAGFRLDPLLWGHSGQFTNDSVDQSSLAGSQGTWDEQASCILTVIRGWTFQESREEVEDGGTFSCTTSGIDRWRKMGLSWGGMRGKR